MNIETVNMLDLNFGHQLRITSPIYNKSKYVTECFNVCDPQDLYFLQIFPNVLIALKKKIRGEGKEAEQGKRRDKI